MDLAAVIDAAARQHHRHSLPHLLAVVTLVHRPHCLHGQDSTTTLQQEGKHGDQTAAERTSESSSTGLTNAGFGPRRHPVDRHEHDIKWI